MSLHDNVIKWKHFPRYWPFVWRIHRFRWIPRTKDQWRGASICDRINFWVNNREADNLRRTHAHYDVTVIWTFCCCCLFYTTHSCDDSVLTANLRIFPGRRVIKLKAEIYTSRSYLLTWNKMWPTQICYAVFLLSIWHRIQPYQNTRVRTECYYITMENCLREQT